MVFAETLYVCVLFLSVLTFALPQTHALSYTRMYHHTCILVPSLKLSHQHQHKPLALTEEHVTLLNLRLLRDVTL
eukprot:m.358022 g.358022  ORF g.358022 m.358022 type:complete len:75 (+) comp18019_c0_seq1:798-1022(+)